MTVREVTYYCMNNHQLGKEVKRLSRKLDAETDVKKRIKYLKALGDVAKTIIRKNRDNEILMKHVTNELDKLKAQIKEVL